MDENTYVSRPRYEALLRKHRDTQDVKVLTGVRRCGKSCLLSWLANDLPVSGVPQHNVLYLRMDAFGMPLQPTAEWLAGQVRSALESAEESAPFYVLLDEVQDVPGWERVVRQLHTRPNTDVYVTGSNAYVLSSELATLLGGRYVELAVYPLSFEEYLAFSAACDVRVANEDAAFADYLRFGGMPALFRLAQRREEDVSQLLRTIYETIILNDVVARLRIADIDLLSKLVRYVFSTSGTLFSTNKIVNTLASSGRKASQETIDGYLRGLVNALVLYECPQVGIAGRDVLRPLRKFYPVDTGLRNLMHGFGPGDMGFQLENVVHNELLRRGWDVAVGTLRVGEVDFVATRPQERLYVQVSESVTDPQVLERELAPFGRLDDSWPTLLIVADHLGCGVTERGTRIVHIVEWLLEES